jgi:hypothetical protein
LSYYRKKFFEGALDQAVLVAVWFEQVPAAGPDRYLDLVAGPDRNGGLEPSDKRKKQDTDLLGAIIEGLELRAGAGWHTLYLWIRHAHSRTHDWARELWKLRSAYAPKPRWIALTRVDNIHLTLLSSSLAARRLGSPAQRRNSLQGTRVA